MIEAQDPVPPEVRSLSARPLILFVGAVVIALLAYLLRGVLVPLFLAFLLAYALDPFVDRLEAAKIPRPLGAIAVMSAIAGLIAAVLVFAVPMFIDTAKTS